MKMRNMTIMHRKYLALEQYHYNYNETPTVRGLAANNNNMQSVLMGNMETI